MNLVSIDEYEAYVVDPNESLLGTAKRLLKQIHLRTRELAREFTTFALHNKHTLLQRTMIPSMVALAMGVKAWRQYRIIVRRFQNLFPSFQHINSSVVMEEVMTGVVGPGRRNFQRM